MATTFDTHKNLASSTVVTPPTPAASGTTLIVADGTVFPTPTVPYNLTIWPVNAVPTPSNSEIVRVTALSTNTLTIQRIQESSSARAITVGDNVALTITKKAITDIETAVNTLENTGNNNICDGRLTLTTVTPVTTADVTGAVSIFWTPFKGNRIALYSGTVWSVRTFSEITIPLGTITSALCYDVFAYDNAGVVACEILAWSSASARATALVLQDGVLVKSGATTRRYLGTFYTTSTTTTEDSLAKRYLWNYYNRVQRQLQKFETTATWNYTTATFRQANGAATNQVELVTGVAEDAVSLMVQGYASNASAVIVSATIGLDSTTTPAGNQIGAEGNTTSATVCAISARYEAIPAIGRHFYAWLEASTASGTTTWSGMVFGVPGFKQMGLSGRMSA